MGKAGAVFGILIIMIALILSPRLLTAFDSWSYAESTTIAAITTGAGVYTGNATLGYELYNDNLDNIVSVNSTDSSDTPAPSSYSHATKSLAIAGLTESVTRSLTIEYRTVRDDDLLATLAPFMGILIILFLIILGAGIAFVTWQKGR
jgi:hypothetical protein